MFLIFHRSFYTTEALAQRSFYRQTPLHREAFTRKRWLHTAFFAEGRPYTHKFSHAEAFSHRRSDADAFPHRGFYSQTGAFAHKSFYTEAFTEMLLHSHACFRTGVFSQGRLYTEKLLRRSAFRHRTFYTRCLHTQACTQRSFYTQRLSRIFLLTDAFTRSFYREAFTNRSPLLVRQTLLHIETVAHRSFCKPKPAFYAQKLLRREVLADRCCSHRRSQKLLHTDTFFTQKLLHGEIVTSCSFRRRTPLHYTQKLLHKRSFCAQMQLHADTFPHRGPVTQRSFDTGKL